MFDFIKLKKRQKELEIIKESIIKEKEELEAIKQILESKTPKVDISDIYVFTYGGISYLGRLESIDDAFYEIKDIFNNQVIFNFFKNCSIPGNKIYMEYNERYNGEDLYATLVPIIEKTPDFLIYFNRQVPEYILEQYLYRINNLDVRNYVKSKIN